MKTSTIRPSKNFAGPLRHAAATGKLERVRELVTKGADPNKRATGQPTPLIVAASAGHLAVVKELLSMGANPSFAHGGKRGTTALLEAVRHHRFDVASVLIAAGADVHHDWSGEGQNITYETAKLCNDLFKSANETARRQVEPCLTVMRELLAAGGRTKPGPFRNAAAFGNKKLLRLLLEFDTDVNELDQGNTAIEGAVLFHQENIAVELLRLGADPWAGEPIPGFGPVLHEAVVRRLTKVVRAIIEAKSDLDRRGDVVIGKAPPETLIEDKDVRGNAVGREWKFHPPPKARNATALIVAVRIGSVDMTRLLVKGAADLEVTDGDGFTPLAWALKLNHKDIATLLRHAGAKEPAHLEGSPLKALVTAAEAGDLGKVRAAIAAGADVNAVYEADQERYTALMQAAGFGHLQVVDELLEAGANPDLGGIDRSLNAGITPLMLAARAGHTLIVKRLLEAGAHQESRQVNLFSLMMGPKKERGLPLDAAVHEAASAGHAEIVRLLMEAGARSGDKSGASGTALEAAATSGNKQTLETVFSRKGQKRQKAGANAQVLIAAVESGNRESVRMLVESGVDVNARSRRGGTALASAAMNGDTEMVKLLLGAGAKPSPCLSKTLLNELMCAASGGYGDIVQLLLDAGANVDDQGADGETALHWAVTHARAEVVEILINAGASTGIRNEEGKTPLQTARQIISAWSGMNRHPLGVKLTNLEGYKRCVKLLESAAKAVKC